MSMFLTMFLGWEKGAIRRDYIPGDLDFDPAGLKPPVVDFNTMSPEFIEKRTKELNNGRLAMLAVAGFIAQVRVL